MRTNSAQLAKEARQLAWPWALFMLAGSAVLAHRLLGPVRTGPWASLTEWVLPIGTFFGASLLAALPLGSEFQYRTLALRLAQPLERRSLWRQKFAVTVAAVAPLAALYSVAAGMRFGRPFAVMCATWIIVTLAGAIPATLLARSIIGGMVLNTFGSSAVSFGWMYYEKHGQIPPGWLWAMGMVLGIYSGVMIWLGRRMLLRFQAVDGMQADESFVPGARLVPRAVAEWFRCRPTQPLRNLLRREFRLVRTLWPLTLLNLAAWTLLVVLRRLPTDRPESLQMPFALTVILGVLIAVLAGTLSLGEEKTWGTHEWHMTLPVSASTQWAVKLVFALITSLVCTALVPMAVLVLGGWLGRPTAQFLTTHVALGWTAEAAGLTLVAFWCACVVKGTVQATIWVFPLCFGVALGGSFAGWLVDRLQGPLQKLAESIVSRLDVMTIHWAMVRAFTLMNFETVAALVLAPLVGVGLIQSRRFFRAQMAAHRLRVVRCALPPVLVAFLWIFLAQLLMGVLVESWQEKATILRDTDAVIAAVQADSRFDTRRPLRLSPADLAGASRLSGVTQRWLRTASVTVVPAPKMTAGPGPYFSGQSVFVIHNVKDRQPYAAVVRTAGGGRCSLMFQVHEAGRYGFLSAICD
jgi:hypothetical protein